MRKGAWHRGTYENKKYPSQFIVLIYTMIMDDNAADDVAGYDILRDYEASKDVSVQITRYVMFTGVVTVFRITTFLSMMQLLQIWRIWHPSMMTHGLTRIIIRRYDLQLAADAEIMVLGPSKHLIGPPENCRL